jgi:hypothetical protein
MLLTHYYAVAIAAVLLTGAWLFTPHERTAITTLGAFLAWGLAALLGGSTETYARAAAVVKDTGNTTVAVPQGDALVAAPVPDEIRLFATMWALLSLLALMLYAWGVYPPEDDEPADPGGKNP